MQKERERRPLHHRSCFPPPPSSRFPSLFAHPPLTPVPLTPTLTCCSGASLTLNTQITGHFNSYPSSETDPFASNSPLLHPPWQHPSWLSPKATSSSSLTLTLKVSPPHHPTPSSFRSPIPSYPIIELIFLQEA